MRKSPAPMKAAPVRPPIRPACVAAIDMDEGAPRIRIPVALLRPPAAAYAVRVKRRVHAPLCPSALDLRTGKRYVAPPRYEVRYTTHVPYDEVVRLGAMSDDGTHVELPPPLAPGARAPDGGGDDEDERPFSPYAYDRGIPSWLYTGKCADPEFRSYAERAMDSGAARDLITEGIELRCELYTFIERVGIGRIGDSDFKPPAGVSNAWSMVPEHLRHFLHLYAESKYSRHRPVVLDRVSFWVILGMLRGGAMDANVTSSLFYPERRLVDVKGDKRGARWAVQDISTDVAATRWHRLEVEIMRLRAASSCAYMLDSLIDMKVCGMEVLTAADHIREASVPAPPAPAAAVSGGDAFDFLDESPDEPLRAPPPALLARVAVADFRPDLRAMWGDVTARLLVRAPFEADMSRHAYLSRGVAVYPYERLGATATSRFSRWLVSMTISARPSTGLALGVARPDARPVTTALRAANRARNRMLQTVAAPFVKWCAPRTEPQLPGGDCRYTMRTVLDSMPGCMRSMVGRYLKYSQRTIFGAYLFRGGATPVQAAALMRPGMTRAPDSKYHSASEWAGLVRELTAHHRSGSWKTMATYCATLFGSGMCRPCKAAPIRDIEDIASAPVIDPFVPTGKAGYAISACRAWSGMPRDAEFRSPQHHTSVIYTQLIV